MVTVYIPEYVVGHWWEQILHNQSALRLKGRLLFTPGVMVTSVPYHLASSGKAEERIERETANAPPDGARSVTADRERAASSRSRSGRSRTAGTVWRAMRAG